MFKEKAENVEVYFICYKKEEMDLVESYYDEILDIHYWYFNAYLAYKYWKNNFKKLKIKKMAKTLLTVAASRYILYLIENEKYISDEEYKSLKKELKKIKIKLEKIIEENNIFLNL